MSWLANAQYAVYLVLSIAALGVELWALVDCVRRRPDAFVAAGKRTKNFWMLVTGVAALVGFATAASPAALGLLGIAALIGVSRQAASTIREQRSPAPHNADDLRPRSTSG